MVFVSWNGSHLPSSQPFLTTENRSFKYGDGFFETIKVLNGSIQLMKYHFDRIVKSAAVLKMDISYIDKDFLKNDILLLCSKNECIQKSRVRVSFYRNEKNTAEYIIEALPYIQDKKSTFSIDLYADIQKPIDILSSLKTANYLPNILASMNAQSNSLDDCLITNTKGNICDSSKANVFIIKNGVIVTPSLTEGCVDGTMRRYLIEKAEKHKFRIVQDEISFDQVLNADEIFLTNAIIGLQSVSNCRERIYSDHIALELNNRIFEHFDQLLVD